MRNETRSDIDQARKATYKLLARLYLEEVDAATAEYLRQIPGLAEHVPASDTDLSAWLQALKVEHQRLFGMNVYPYESVFVGDEVMLNTAATQRVVAFYRECGFEPARNLRFGAPDHIGVEMTLMAELIQAGQSTDQGRLLHQHLAAWVPIFARAVARIADQPFYRALADLTIEFLLSDLENVPAPAPEPQPDVIPLQPMDTQPEVDDEGPGLNAVVNQLLTPSRAGVFLSRVDILRLAQRVDLPAGLLDRSLMLKNLLRAAGQYDLIAELLDALTQVVEEADEQYANWAGAYPAWSRQAENWRTRTRAGLILLAEMRRSADA